jgi:cbb3-type cytochrome oxidase maturation protein
MDILYLLIPMSAVLVLVIIGVFGWALHRGQFEDLEHEGVRILQQDPMPAASADPPLDADQAAMPRRPEELPQRTMNPSTSAPFHP